MNHSEDNIVLDGKYVLNATSCTSAVSHGLYVSCRLDTVCVSTAIKWICMASSGDVWCLMSVLGCKRTRESHPNHPFRQSKRAHSYDNSPSYTRLVHLFSVLGFNAFVTGKIRHTHNDNNTKHSSCILTHANTRLLRLLCHLHS